MSISLGITSVLPSMDGDIDDLLEDIIKTTDSLLYRAKETGRNKVVYGWDEDISFERKELKT